MTALYLCWTQRNRRFQSHSIGLRNGLRIIHILTFRRYVDDFVFMESLPLQLFERNGSMLAKSKVISFGCMGLGCQNNLSKTFTVG